MGTEESRTCRCCRSGSWSSRAERGRPVTRRRPARDKGARGCQARCGGRPRGLPNGRAVVGGFLVAVAASGVFAAYRGANTGPAHRYAVTRHNVTSGTTLGPDDLDMIAVELPTDLRHRAFEQSD